MTEMETEMGTAMVTAMVTKRTDMSYVVVSILCFRLSLKCACICTRVNASIYIYISIAFYSCSESAFLKCVPLHSGLTVFFCMPHAHIMVTATFALHKRFRMFFVGEMKPYKPGA